jgi:glucosyl-3-phosphoglycerate synthase
MWRRNTPGSNLLSSSRETEDLGSKLKLSARRKKTVLVIPALATEFTLDENRPVFLNILKQIGRLTYLSNIIFGLDRATDAEAQELASLCRQNGIRNAVIQHNDGEDFRRLYQSLNEGVDLTLPGKGRNMLCHSASQAMGAGGGVLDADIRTFTAAAGPAFTPSGAGLPVRRRFTRDRGQPDVLRVKRLLWTPCFWPSKRKFSESGDDKSSPHRLPAHFNYQLSEMEPSK